MINPDKLRYAESHEWLLVDGENGTIGITKFAVDQLTDLIRIGLETLKPGTKLRAGKPFGEIESVKAVSDLYSPVDGEVVAVNPVVVDDVLVLNEDPYTKGWLLKVKLDDPSQAKMLMDLATYERKLGESEHH